MSDSTAPPPPPPGDSALDPTHGLSTGLITVAVARGWTMFNGLNVDLQPQLEAGLAAGAAAVVADTLLKDPSTSPMMKAVATGAVLAGAMWAWKQDQNVQVWVPVGAVSYFLSDKAMEMWARNQARQGGRHGGRYGANGGGQQQGPVVPGM